MGKGAGLSPGGRGSQGPGDDGEGQDGTAGLQLQGGQEALSGGVVVALRLQHLPQAVPHVVGRGVHLHRVPQDLLRQAVALQLVEDQALRDNAKQRDGHNRKRLRP